MPLRTDRNAIVPPRKKIQSRVVRLLTTAKCEANTRGKYVLKPALRARRVKALHAELERAQVSIEPVLEEELAVDAEETELRADAAAVAEAVTDARRGVRSDGDLELLDRDREIVAGAQHGRSTHVVRADREEKRLPQGEDDPVVPPREMHSEFDLGTEARPTSTSSAAAITARRRRVAVTERRSLKIERSARGLVGERVGGADDPEQDQRAEQGL